MTIGADELEDRGVELRREINLGDAADREALVSQVAAYQAAAARDYALAEEWKATAEGYRVEAQTRRDELHSSENIYSELLATALADADRLRVDLYNLGVECERLRAELDIAIVAAKAKPEPWFVAEQRVLLAALQWHRLDTSVNAEALHHYCGEALKARAGKAKAEQSCAETGVHNKCDCEDPAVVGYQECVTTSAQVEAVASEVVDWAKRTTAEQRVLEACAQLKVTYDGKSGDVVIDGARMLDVVQAEFCRREGHSKKRGEWVVPCNEHGDDSAEHLPNAADQWVLDGMRQANKFSLLAIAALPIGATYSSLGEACRAELARRESAK